MPRKSSPARIDNPEHRAVYFLVAEGKMRPELVGMFKRQLVHLADLGVITKRPDGTYAVVPGDAIAPEPVEEMVTVSVRVPVAIAQALESMGPTRSEAARAILGRALGSGVRKATG